MRRNIFFILLDGCEFNVFENREFATKIAPNIAGLIRTGVLKKK